MIKASLYIHVPFCKAKCDYCDFFSIPINSNDQALFNNYINSILFGANKLFMEGNISNVPTLYIGGGTPSLFNSEDISRLLKDLLEVIKCYSSLPMEITLEANPESINEEFLDAIRKAGVTRLSLGVQTFYEPSRIAVNRIGYNKELNNTIALASSYFKNALSIDLISGLPLQSETILMEDISASLFFSPVHVSLYALNVDAGTALAKNKNIILPGSEESDNLWLIGRDTLLKAGFSQYEVSNFCIKGYESLHNIRYWRMESWHALGPSASGTIIPDKDHAFRYTHSPDMEIFFKENELFPNKEYINKTDLIKESLLMGFRYINGPDEDLFYLRFGIKIEDIIPKTLNSWDAYLQKNRIALTNDGLLFLNPFLVDAFIEIEKTSQDNQIGGGNID